MQIVKIFCELLTKSTLRSLVNKGIAEGTVEMKKARDRALTHRNTEQECLPLHHLTKADKILEVHCISLLSYDGKGTKWEMRRMV